MFVKISEQPSLYNDLEKKSVREILEDINREDQKVALAVQKAIPQIEKLVTQIVPRMKQGGRIFYMGAGTSGRLGVLDASEIPPTFGMRRKITIFLRQILSKLFYEQSILFITDPRVGIILNREPIPVQELNHRVDSHVQFSLYLN